jgi:hypothetical protein
MYFKIMRKNYHQVRNKCKEGIELLLDKKIKGERKYFWMKKDFIKLVLLFFN